MTTGRVNQVSLQETCCFARRLNKQAFLHYLDALLLFLEESPEDLAQPVRQAYDYWSFLGRKHAVSGVRPASKTEGIELQIVA